MIPVPMPFTFRPGLPSKASRSREVRSLWMLAMADWARRTARTWGVSRASEPLAADIQGRTNHDAVQSDRLRIHVRIRRFFSLARRVVERWSSGAGWGGGNPD